MALSDHLRVKDWTFSSTSRAAQRRNEFALYVLIASLGMFFTAAVVGYLLIRLRSGGPAPDLRLPPVLWLSTALAVAGSAFLWRALRAVRRERQEAFRRNLLTAFVLGAGFCLSQSVGLTAVLRDHFAAARENPPTERPEPSVEKVRPTVLLPPPRPDAEAGTPAGEPFPVRTHPAARAPRPPRLEGLVFVLILLHALHFIAGMVGLTVVTVRGLAGRYDHEYHGGVRLCAVYWRFLDVVWIALFGAFLVTA
ncbi:MAG TPA: cytochrome c oxidase subunit 3 [Planctomycetaceae bacterium]